MTCCDRSKNWCEFHLNEVSQKIIERRKDKLQAGLCRDCNNQISPYSTIHCAQHLEMYKNIRRNRKNNGQCRDCCKPVVNSTGFCEDHYRRHNKICKQSMEKPTNKYNKLKRGAEKRKISFSISCEEFCEWCEKTPRVCRYCEVDEKLLKTSAKPRAVMSIDRRNNQEGYNLENICLACYRCNNNKGAFFTELEWLEIAEKCVKPRLKKYHHLP